MIYVEKYKGKKLIDAQDFFNCTVQEKIKQIKVYEKAYSINTSKVNDFCYVISIGDDPINTQYRIFFDMKPC